MSRDRSYVHPKLRIIRKKISQTLTNQGSRQGPSCWTDPLNDQTSQKVHALQEVNMFWWMGHMV